MTSEEISNELMAVVSMRLDEHDDMVVNYSFDHLKVRNVSAVALRVVVAL